MMFEHRISGYDFVRAMVFAGYRLLGTTMGHSLLERGDVELVVPQRGELSDEELTELLDAAGVPPLQLGTLLNRLGSRDTLPSAQAAAALDDELQNAAGRRRK